ncbi:mucin-binding protein, partial [Lactococcus lactis]|uniref:mucin-binding protein n=1 Tax=Lactococcus lactis TaxID=1358 RepID=UPI000539EAD4
NYLDKETNKVVSKQVVQTVEYHRTAIVDKVTGELLGYDTDNDGQADLTVEEADNAWASDDNKWKEVSSPDLSSRGFGSPSMLSVNQENTKFDDQDKEVNIYYSHALATVTPDNPGTPGSPINPEDPDGPKWPEGTDKASLSKTITRTINYLD